MTRQSFIFLIILFPLLVHGTDTDELKEAEEWFCNRSGVDVDIQRNVAEAAWHSNLLVQLLSGNTKEATESLSFLLSTNVVAMYQNYKRNPCKANEESLKDVLPIIRVVAAVNNKTPLPGWAENKEALAVLDYAIKDNPQHYQELVSRSKEWDDGI